MNMQTTSIIPYTVKPNDVLWKIAEEFNTTIYAIAVLNPGIDINTIRVGETIFVWPGLGANVQTAIPNGEGELFTRSEIELNRLMRLLWEQHVAWTRMAIMSIIFNLPDQSFTINRLLRNASDFEQVFRRHYTPSTAAKFGSLMKEHLEIGVRLITAARNNDQSAFDTLQRQWFKNADEISAFLNSINSYWSEETMKDLWYNHLRMTIDETSNMIQQRYLDSIEDYNKLEIEALRMADAMTNGIIVQFRDLFF